MTTFVKLSSPNTQAAAPFSFGIAFKKGDIPASFVLDTANYQVAVMARWNDGSAKHAIVSGRAALTATVQATLTATPGTPPTGANLTAADIVAAAPTATVQCGTFGTATLASVLASAPLRTWVSGPEMVECHYRTAELSGTLLAAEFHVQLYAGGAMHIDVIVENGYLDNGAGAIASNADRAYVPTVAIGGTTAWTNSGASLTHCRNTRWMKDGWIGTDPQITPQHDVEYLRASKLVPNYSLSNPNSTTLNALNQTYVPMAEGAVPFGMAAPGANSSIALLPSWNGMYLGNGDARAYRAVLASSSSMNSFGICWRDFTTKKIVKPSAFATWSIYGPSTGGDRGFNCTNGAQWEINHHPGESFLAYLLTGSRWHYDTMMLQASFMWAVRGRGTVGVVTMGDGVNRIIVHETRGTAWFIRSMSQACALTPTGDTIAAEYQTLLANNMTYWKATADQAGINQLGYLYEYASSGLLNGYGNGWNPPWQQHWWMQSLGYGSDLEPLADMTNFVYVRNWLYKGIVGILGAYGVDFPYAIGSVYNTKISTGTSLDPTTWLDSWYDVATGTLAHLSGGYVGLSDPHALQNGGDMSAGQPVPATGGSGDPSDATFGRWGYLLPAIAYAAEHGADGAADAWARITSASNYSTLTGAGFDQSPQWGIFPRSVGEANIVTTPGPSIAMGVNSVLGDGSVVMDTRRGFGIPLDEVPSGGTDGTTPWFDAIEVTDNPASEMRIVITKQGDHGLWVGDGMGGGYYESTDGLSDSIDYDIFIDGSSEPIDSGTMYFSALTHTLIGSTTTQANTAGTGVVRRVVFTTGAASDQVNFTITGAITQVQRIAGANSIQANTSSVGMLASSAQYTLAGAPSSQANGSSTGALVQTHRLTGATTTEGHVTVAGTVGQEIMLAALSAVQLKTSSSGVIIQGHVISGAASAQMNIAALRAITLVHPLTAAATVQANSSSVASISNLIHILAGAPGAQANASAGVSIVQQQQLAAAPTVQVNPALAGDITQLQVLAGAAAVQVNASTARAIVHAHTLAAAAATQANAVAVGALAQQHALAVAGTLQVNVSIVGSIDGSTQIISAAPAAQTNATSNAAITQVQQLTVASVAQDNAARAAAVSLEFNLVGGASAQANAGTGSAVVISHALDALACGQSNRSLGSGITGDHVLLATAGLQINVAPSADLTGHVTIRKAPSSQTFRFKPSNDSGFIPGW